MLLHRPRVRRRSSLSSRWKSRLGWPFCRELPDGRRRAGDLRHGLLIDRRLVVSYLRLNAGNSAGSMVLRLLDIPMAKPVLNRVQPCAPFGVHGIRLQRPRQFL